MPVAQKTDARKTAQLPGTALGNGEGADGSGVVHQLDRLLFAGRQGDGQGRGNEAPDNARGRPSGESGRSPRSVQRNLRSRGLHIARWHHVRTNACQFSTPGTAFTAPGDRERLDSRLEEVDEGDAPEVAEPSKTSPRKRILLWALLVALFLIIYQLVKHP